MDPNVVLLGAFGTSLLAFFTLLVKVFITDPRDRRWSAEDAEKKAAQVMAASSKDAERVILASRHEASEVKLSSKADAQTVMLASTAVAGGAASAAEHAYHEANTVNAKIEALQLDIQQLSASVSAADEKLASLTRGLANRRKDIEDELRAAGLRLDRVEDASTKGKT